MLGDRVVEVLERDQVQDRRKGLVALVNRRSAPLGPDRLTVEALLTLLGDFGEHTDRAKLADFRAMVVSVNEEWDDRGA